jgi:uncharacterized protein (TIGR03435 family)
VAASSLVWPFASKSRFLLAFSLAALVYPQTPDSSLFFDAASVKLSPERVSAVHRRGCNMLDPGTFVCTEATVTRMAMIAFGLKPYQLPGSSLDSGPSFEVVARVSKGTTQALAPVMLQNLLVERFGLKYHFEKREMPAYTLTVAKGGPKLKASPPAPTDPTGDGPGPPSTWRPGLYGAVMPAHPPRAGMGFDRADCTKGFLIGGATTDLIADRLSLQLARPVTNATELKGEFDFVLVFLNENCEPSGSLPPSDAPSLSTAVEEQLGLRLEKGRGMIDVFLIDHVEKNPTEN